MKFRINFKEASMDYIREEGASASATRIFDIPFYFSSNEWHLLLEILAILSMILGNLIAITQTSMKRSTRTEIKHWVELFFGVKVIAMNSHRLPGKSRRMGPIMGHTMHYTYDHYAST
ncbi:hypothetical protein H5410_017373, partial [Solanum commersonii]